MKNINVFNRIISTLNQNSKHIIGNCVEDKLSKKMFLNDFIKIMVYYFIKDLGSIRKLSTNLKTNNLNLKKLPFETIRDGFNRFNYKVFRDIFFSLVMNMRMIKIPELELLGKLYIVDSSLFNINIKADWSSYRKGKNRFKLHMVWDLNGMMVREIKIRSGKSSDLTELKSLIEKNITYICDRAYVSFDLFKCFIDKGSYFVIRGRKNLLYNVVKRKEELLNDELLVKDQIITFINDKSNTLYRMISFKVNGKEYNLITNRFSLLISDVILLYILRWQIELIFNFIKNKLNGKHLLSHSENGLYIQFYLISITQLLLMSFKYDNYFLYNDVEFYNIDDYNNIENVRNVLLKYFKRYYIISIHFLVYIREVLSLIYNHEIALEVNNM